MCNFRERKQEMIKARAASGMELREKTSLSPLSHHEPQESGHVVFTVYGNFDRELVPNVFDGITPLFTKQRERVIMNLKGVTGINSAGIATIVECIRMASDSETEFHIIGVNEKIKEVLDLAKSSSFFENIEFRAVPYLSGDPGSLVCRIKKKPNIRHISFIGTV